MDVKTTDYREAPRTTPRRLPWGTSVIEALVALTLLSTALTLSVQIIVRHGRLLVAARQYRLAFDELTNQLDRLTAMPADEVPSELQRLTPSPFAASRLPGAVLSGQLAPADLGHRITLRIVWDEPQRSAAPVSLTAWVVPKPPPAGGQTPGSE
jgi:hypothetical protein